MKKFAEFYIYYALFHIKKLSNSHYCSGMTTQKKLDCSNGMVSKYARRKN